MYHTSHPAINSVRIFLHATVEYTAMDTQNLTSIQFSQDSSAFLAIINITASYLPPKNPSILTHPTICFRFPSNFLFTVFELFSRSLKSIHHPCSVPPSILHLFIVTRASHPLLAFLWTPALVICMQPKIAQTVWLGCTCETLCVIW